MSRASPTSRIKEGGSRIQTSPQRVNRVLHPGHRQPSGHPGRRPVSQPQARRLFTRPEPVSQSRSPGVSALAPRAPQGPGICLRTRGRDKLSEGPSSGERSDIQVLGQQGYYIPQRKTTIYTFGLWFLQMFFTDYHEALRTAKSQGARG